MPTLADVPSAPVSTLRPAGAWRLLVRELSAFGVVGALCFVLDVGLFQLLYATVGLGAVTAKALSTLVSLTAAYLGHRFWSFSHRQQTPARRQYLVFMAINGATLVLGLVVLAVVRYPLGQESALVLQVANVGSIVAGTVIRYLSYRRWVFPDRVVEPSPEVGAPSGQPNLAA